jgi:26S proteasome regulatory subunit N12
VGDYAGFHTLLEGLENSEEGKEAVEKDEFVRYPVRLEQALMEGSYDKVWSEMKGERVPSEEFAIFSEVSCVLLMCNVRAANTVINVLTSLNN